jgi:dihydrofolate reductase
MGKIVMYASVSVDGFIAKENDDPGPIFDWLTSGDVPLDESGVLKVSQASRDHTLAYWGSIGVTVVGRHVFDITDGWGGVPPSGVAHVVVVTHRPPPDGWDPQAPFHFLGGIDAAMAKARELAAHVASRHLDDLAAGYVDEVRMDLAPVVLGSGKRFFGTVSAPRLLDGPDTVIEGERVLHLTYRVRR